jgi:glycosyltransferase involved in cell wall biosynthesis
MSEATEPRVFFLFHGRFPSEKAASIFLENEARSFAEAARDVTIVAAARRGRTGSISIPGVRIVYVPTIDLVPLGFMQGFCFRLSLAAYSWSALVHLVLHARRDDIIISTEALPLLVASYLSPRTLFELHDYPERSFQMFARLFRRVRHILVTNRWKLDRFTKDYPACAPKAFLEPNAVNVERFAAETPRSEARTRLGLPQGGLMAVYTGHLYAWKGVDTLAAAARLLPNVEVYVVGGTEADISAYKARWGAVPNLHVVGHRPHAEMPLWQRAADVIVLPNTAKEEISAHYTSPMKLFEYMASGTPIVASDIPSIREVTGDDRAVLVEPDSPEALASGIRVALSSMSQKSRLAKEWVMNHTWQERARRILKRAE